MLSIASKNYHLISKSIFITSSEFSVVFIGKSTRPTNLHQIRSWSNSNRERSHSNDELRRHPAFVSQKSKRFDSDRETQKNIFKITNSTRTNQSLNSMDFGIQFQRKFISTTKSFSQQFDPYKIDLYALLGVNPKATQEEIKKKWTEKAKQFHPDISKDKDAQTKFIEITKGIFIFRFRYFFYYSCLICFHSCLFFNFFFFYFSL